MAIRLEKSGELMMIYGTRDEQEDQYDQQEWHSRRSKLGVLAVAIGVVVALFLLGPHLPGHVLISHAIKSVISAIW